MAKRGHHSLDGRNMAVTPFDFEGAHIQTSVDAFKYSAVMPTWCCVSLIRRLAMNWAMAPPWMMYSRSSSSALPSG